MANDLHDGGCPSRRGFLGGVGVVGLATLVAGGGASPAAAAPLTRAERDAMTPDQVIQAMLDGNARFTSGQPLEHDFLAEQRASSAGQYPAAAVLTCIDSRTPVEVVCDLGLGNAFTARVAGSVVDDDVLGGLEFSCAVSGAKAVMVMGHTSCGAVKGAIDDVVLGNLTGLVAKIRPAVVATEYTGERTSRDFAFVDAVARTNTVMGVERIRERSQLLREMEKRGEIRMVGAMYDLSTGKLVLI